MLPVLDSLIPKLVTGSIAMLVTLGVGHELTDAMAWASTAEWHRQRGKIVCWQQLRRTPGGCLAELAHYAEAFVAAGERHDLDPWLLAALSYHESRWIADATGPVEERGIFQIHPARREARDLAVFDDLAWLGCRARVGQCQGPVIEVAASILRRALDKTGEIEAALSLYQRGRVTESGRAYGRKVIRTAEKLRGGKS